MVSQNKLIEAVNFCLREMFLRVGEKYPNEDLTNQTDWFRLRSWTIEEEDRFKKWMIWYLRKKLRLPKYRAIEQVSWFLMMYGWTNQHSLYMKVIKNG